MSHLRSYGPQWKKNFIFETNKLQGTSPQENFTGDFRSLSECINQGINNMLIHPTTVHKLLTQDIRPGHAGLYRTYESSFMPPAVDVKVMIEGWMAISAEALHHSSFKTETEAVRRILALHYDFCHITPFVETQRVGRLLMVNQAVYADVDVPIITLENTPDYYKRCSPSLV